MNRPVATPGVKQNLELSNRESALIFAFRLLDDDRQCWIGDLTESVSKDDEFRRHKKPSLRLIGGAA